MTTLVLLVTLAAAGVVTAELAARWGMRRYTRYRVWPPRMRLEVRQHRGLSPDLEPRVRFEVNADGERGADARAHEDGVFRILTVGGSSVECYALDQPTSWPGALERLLNEPEALEVLGARRVHVGNIGHSGVGAAELDMNLEPVLPNYDRLDAIVVMVGASTAYHWLEDGAPAAREPTVVPELALFGRHPQQPFGWTPRATALLELARRLRQAWVRPVEIKEDVGAWIVTGRTMRAEAQDIRTVVADPDTMLEHFERHFRQALRRATAHASRVLVVRQPWFDREHYTNEEQGRFWHGGIGRPWKERVSVYFSLEVINRVLSLIDSRVARIAAEFDLPALNLLPHLNRGLRHYYDHDHFTPEGAGVAARTIAAALTGAATAAAPVVEARAHRRTLPRIPLAARG